MNLFEIDLSLVLRVVSTTRTRVQVYISNLFNSKTYDYNLNIHMIKLSSNLNPAYFIHVEKCRNQRIWWNSCYSDYFQHFLHIQFFLAIILVSSFHFANFVWICIIKVEFSVSYICRMSLKLHHLSKFLTFRTGAFSRMNYMWLFHLPCELHRARACMHACISS